MHWYNNSTLPTLLRKVLKMKNFKSFFFLTLPSKFLVRLYFWRPKYHLPFFNQELPKRQHLRRKGEGNGIGRTEEGTGESDQHLLLGNNQN